MKYLINIFFCLLLFVAEVTASIGKYPIKNFAPIDYKAGIQNIDFAQNGNTNLFVANNLGVLTYNGNEWTLHAIEPGQKERSLAFDKENKRLYVGSQGSFGYVEDDWTYTSLVDLIPKSSRDFDEVWDVYVINSKVYFCTFNGIYIYDGKSIQVISQDEGLQRSFIVNGKLLTQNHQGELFQMKDDTLESLYAKSSTQSISGVIPHQDGLLLFYNSGEIIQSTSYGAKAQFSKLSELLRGKYVNNVIELSDSRLAIATQTAGILIYDIQKERIENITKEDGLQSNACLRLFQDYAGNLWVGMQNGIGLIDINSPMRFINQEIGLQGSGYDSFETTEGTYFSTSNGIFYLANNSTESQFITGTEGPAYSLQKIANKLYAGHHTGLFLLEGGKAYRIANIEGLWQVKQLQSDPEYAIGGTYSGLYLFKLNDNKTLYPLQHIDGFTESSRFFEEDRKGRIWVGQFYKGLYQLTLDEGLLHATIRKISDEYELPIGQQIILSRIDNEIYFGTFSGIYQLDQRNDRIIKAKLFEAEVGLDEVYLLSQDNKKNIHVITENLVGIYKRISAKNYHFIPSSLYQLRYSFNNDLLNVSENSDNGMYFNANEGFILYNHELEKLVNAKALPVINKVISVNEDSIIYAKTPFEPLSDSPSEIQLSYKSKVLQFEVESFQFSQVNGQQYRYLLKGFNDDYSEWTNLPIKEYTNLKEGTYEFYVQTKNYPSDTLTSQPFTFKITPPFYRSLVAKFLYIFLGLLSILLVSRIQKRQYKHKTRELEESKKKELAVKQQKLIEIEKQKEKEFSQLREDRIQSEMRHLNNLLAASTMNLVVKNEFLESIKLKLKDVTEKGKNKETKQSLEQIVKNIDSTLRLQDDWKQFTHHFDKVHGDFLSRLSQQYRTLSANEQKLCAFLRLNLNTKDIANLMGNSLRGIEVARYRLRKKLDLEKGQNLSKFILEY